MRATDDPDASEKIERIKPRQRMFLGALFFCSGAVALIYEVLWHRQFSLVFGSAAPATASTLAAYFTGLGIGSFVVGRFASRWKNPLRVYGVLEILVAAGALAVTPILAFASVAYPELNERFSGHTELFLAIKGLISFVAIAAPTMAMGGTLPILAQLVDADKENPGSRIGWLYVVNTAGAALGAVAFPFFLLPTFGMQFTNYLCVTVNVLISAAAFWLSRRSLPRVSVPEKPMLKQREGNQLPYPLVLAFVSGASTFALQVLWNRAFAQIHENSIHSFGLIVTVFILAIAAGSELARFLLKASRNTRRLFGRLWIAGGLLTLLAPSLFVTLSANLEYAALSDASTIGRLLVIAIVVILLPIALLSSGMPLLFHDAIRNSARSTGDRTGSLLAANITGSIIGALLAGFALPNMAGLWKTVIATAAVLLVSAALTIPWKPRLRGFVTVIIVLFAWLFGRSEIPRTRVDSKSGERLLAITEGAHGIVAVIDRDGSRRLKLNNHYVLGGTSAVGDERMQAHIPLVFHGRPGTAAFLGYGTGITAGGALFHTNIQTSAIELVPQVTAFASEFFRESNLGFGTVANSSVFVADAREFLRSGRRKFDVIVGDLVVPWRPGEAGLYTREHFASAKAALNEGGTFCVWIPAFQLNESEFKIILNTFLAEFESAFVFRGDFSPTEPAIALISRESNVPFEAHQIERRLAEMDRDPFNPQLAFPAAFWMHLIGMITRTDLDPSEMRTNTEDLPWVELRASKEARKSREFVGRDLQRWETQVRERSRTSLSSLPSTNAVAGSEAGSLVLEFTLLLNEGRENEAQAVRARIRNSLGESAFKVIFGDAP
jgi:spermidine synthase